MKVCRIAAAALLLALTAVPPAQVAPVAANDVTETPFYAGLGDPASFKTAMDARLNEAQQALARVVAVKGRRTVDNTLRPYDEASIAFGQVIGPAGIVSSLHPDERMRQAGDEVTQRARAMTSETRLNRALADAIAAIDLRGADAETKYYVQRELRDFRLNGVDKDEATREQLKQLQRELAATVQEFSRNIRSDARSIPVASTAELDGLPADFIARHKPDVKGVITLTTDLADVRPVLTFAKNETLRKRLYVEWTNVGHPANIAVLDKMLALRADIARLLGFENWAAYDMADRMSGSVKAASDFIDLVVAASGPKAEREYREILARKRQDVPDATTVNPWENTYYAELVRKGSYDFDSQLVRPYFPYDRVRDGLLAITTKLYGVTFRPVKNVPVWHPSVDVYEMLENGAFIGRCYLDMHPRPNKLGSAAFAVTARAGVAGRQTPEVVLITSVPGGQPDDPGLLTHDEVKGTVFHEFGHLVQALMSGRHKWVGVTRVSERDFVEVPSQLFEEWTWDPATLATFAKHYQTNEPIPAALVNRMRRAGEFGKALGVRQQMIFAKLALSLHDRDPKQVDSTALIRGLTNAYVPFKYLDGTHRQTAFTHLVNANYTASYYTYMWSLVVAQDLFSQFDMQNLLDPRIARRYRDRVLVPGGSKPAAALVEDFLGRPFNERAWTAWLNREPS